ncbi:MAG: AAA family ATPase [Eubacterium coprostanoligenes]|nr:AAA family ATPase [Eubacterium coprostanoligenes]
MKIDRITLHNFGSYEGKTVFETQSHGDRNIVLIGGKNGAGKTTLFTAMRLCLYGYMSMGYKNINSFYNKAIIKLINNTAKLKKPAKAYVELELSLSNGQTLDHYILTRDWLFDDSLTETFTVYKNGNPLTEEEVHDFEKYILSLIPPELFNLYFFDGEKIADFFLEEGSNTRIKDAFLTLCGYDTFDIMRKNFKRISSTTSNDSSLEEYVAAKERYEQIKNQCIVTEQAVLTCKIDIDNCEADIKSLEKEYEKRGGTTQDEWDKKLAQLKEEEKKREGYNQILKKWANDVVPFIMIKDLLEKVKTQIEIENDGLKYTNFEEILSSDAVKMLFDGKLDLYNKVLSIASKKYASNNEEILALSFEQSASLLVQINALIEFDNDKIVECKKLIKKSIAKSARIRNALEKSNVNSVNEYMKTKAELYEKKSHLLDYLVELEKELSEKKDLEQQFSIELKKAQAKLESEIKTASINDISARAILMLDKLQKTLYQNQIRRVEEFFKIEISTLMRKTHFIDDIMIDEEFNIHIYRNENLNINDLKNTIKVNTEEQVISLFGLDAVKKIKAEGGSMELAVAVNKLIAYGKSDIMLPIEIDKTSLSNGEKQILIMAIYHSLVQLCNHEIPFIIDTPFARIDTEHRHNISKYFFSKLNGQVFILSTNEEINSSHVKIMEDKIVATYMLENTDNTRTTVVSNSYFEV